MHLSFFVSQYAEESAYCDYLIENLTVFNDPDEDEYEEEDENWGVYYLGADLAKNYWIFKGVAGGDATAYMRLYFDTPRIDVYKAYAYVVTFHKERRKMERRINGR